MEVFKIYKEDDAIQKFQNNAGKFKLIVQDKNLEIFESEINEGKSIICQPYESKNAINVIFVLSGRLFHTNSLSWVLPGERIEFKDLEFTHHLSVVEKTKILRVRTSVHFMKQAGETNKVYELIHKIQEKDNYTESHCNRSGNLAVQIATLMKVSEKSISNLLHGAKIHDIGKLFVPEHILNKPSQLNPREYELIKRHTNDGYALILKETGNEQLAKIALEHHERLNGSGYPNGLSGDQISIESRIMAVVDSFDAMTTDRPYKKGMSEQVALEELKSLTGTLYDEFVVLTLEKLIHSLMKHQ